MQCSDELIRLRTNKPSPGEQKQVGDLGIPPEKIHHTLVDVVKIGESVGDSMNSVDAAPAENEASSIEMNEISTGNKEGEKKLGDSFKPTAQAVEKMKAALPDDDEKKDPQTKAETADEGKAESTSTEEKPSVQETEVTSDNASNTTSESNKPDAASSDSATGGEKDTNASPTGSAVPAEKAEATENSEEQADETPTLKENSEMVDSKMTNGTAKQDETTKEDDDSDAAVGKEEASKLDQDLMVEESDVKEESTEVTNRKVTVMFQKLLALGGNTGQVSVRISDEDRAGKYQYASDIRFMSIELHLI